MRKIDRLFEIVQLLRGKRLRTAEFIAQEIGVSVRTIYRDIQGLIESGVPIEGERGVGYIIRRPIELPPLQFTPLEFRALQLGIKMVAAVADEELAQAANEAAIKITDVLPYTVSESDDSTAHILFEIDDTTRRNLAILRESIDAKRKIRFAYTDERGRSSERVVRPLGIEYWGRVWTLTAWCELRDDFRVFRIDRIADCTSTYTRFTNENGKTYQDYLKHCVKSDGNKAVIFYY